MNPADRPTSGVAAVPLDDLAPARIGALMRRARKQQSLTRHDVASRIGSTASELRRCERGEARAAPDLIVALADCYGEHLGAQFADRTPIQLETHRIVIGTEEVTLRTNDADELLSAYIGVVGRLRHVKPGEPIALRAEDVTALSTSLGQSAEDVERRIAELLDCTLHEARSLHSELIRRRVIAPTAGLLAGMAIIAGVGCSADTKPSAPAHAREPVAHTREPVSKVAPATARHAIPIRRPTPTVAPSPAPTIAVEGVSATLPEPTTVPVINIGSSLSEHSTTTRPVTVTSTTAHKPPKPSVTTTTTPTATTTPSATRTTAP